MFTRYVPVVGEWYVKNTGKLIKVKMLAYNGQHIANVVIEYLDGSQHVLAFNDWLCLDLNKRISDVSRNMVLR